MRSEAARPNNLFRIAFSALFLGAFGAMFCATSTLPVAAQTSVNASVCATDAGATLALTSPSNDATLTTVPVRLEGTVSLLSQIRIFVDTQYRDTIPLDSSAVSFSHDLPLDAGTHTIRLEGVDVCQRTAPAAEITISYTPEAVVAGAAGSTPITALDSAAYVPGSEAALPAKTAPTLSLPPALESVGEVLRSTLTVLDFASAESFAALPAMATRFTVLSIGLSMAVLTEPTIAGAAIIASKVGFSWPLWIPGVARRYMVAITRVIGLGLVGGLIAFSLY